MDDDWGYPHLWKPYGDLSWDFSWKPYVHLGETPTIFFLRGISRLESGPFLQDDILTDELKRASPDESGRPRTWARGLLYPTY